MKKLNEMKTGGEEEEEEGVKTNIEAHFFALAN